MRKYNISEDMTDHKWWKNHTAAVICATSHAIKTCTDVFDTVAYKSHVAKVWARWGKE